MNIKNFHFLELEKEEQLQLVRAAGMYAANANITFKILKKPKDDEILVEVTQGKNQSNKYQDSKGLIKRTKDLFGRFFPDHRIHVRPVVFIESPVHEVTPEWIEKRMNQTGTSIKILEGETGIAKSNLSAWINGIRTMSQPVKAMFYYKFK
jgi:hypothetical protein